MLGRLGLSSCKEQIVSINFFFQLYTNKHMYFLAYKSDLELKNTFGSFLFRILKGVIIPFNFLN